ncbi:MAG TPA: hypothetical protein VGM27_17545 [Acidobacteriaceae bacterium]|jgi:hypothetical protein
MASCCANGKLLHRVSYEPAGGLRLGDTPIRNPLWPNTSWAQQVIR